MAQKKPSRKKTSVMDQAKDAAKVGFRKQDLPEAYSNDEQINAKQAAFEEKGPRVEMVRDAWEGMIQHRLDDPENPPDPFREAVDQIRKPGKTYRMLSPRVLGRRGKRGWEPERDKDGKVIEIAGQVVASMPIEAAIKRNKKFQKLSQDAVDDSREQFADIAERIQYESKGAVEVLRRGEIVQDRRSPSGQPTGTAAVIGSESFRG
jgi:hypothetical protein